MGYQSPLFAAGSIFGCLLLYAWWAPLSSRNRFFLTQFLPMLFSMSGVILWCCHQFTWEDLKRKFPRLHKWRSPLPHRAATRMAKAPLLVVILSIAWGNVIASLQGISNRKDPVIAARDLSQ